VGSFVIRLLLIAGFLGSCAHGPTHPLAPRVHLTLHVPEDRDIGPGLGFAILEFHKQGIQVVVDDVLEFEKVDILSDRDRHKLSSSYQDFDTIHVFVVKQLPNEDDGDQDAYRGLHWKKMDGRDFIGLSELAKKETLAHEIGHALSLSHHMKAWNLMCATDGDVECTREDNASFTADQGDQMRRAAWKLGHP